MKKMLFVSILFAFSQTHAQNEGNNWFFGDHAGIDFSGGTPTAINGGQTFDSLGYSEGTSALSDEFGNLLMYCNGQSLWNSNHQIMDNGDNLFGNFSSTQSSIILPQPESKQLYYVFTVDDVWESTSNYGFRYSVVDLCENNGDGKVIPEQKNILLLENAFEKLGAVRHANGRDYWIVTHKLNTNEYYAYLLNPNGISPPVVSSVGPMSTYGQGQLKFSPDGSQIAVTHNQHFGGAVQFELFDFDNVTGAISNPIPISSSSYNVYGIEFSPDNSILYAIYSRISPIIELQIMQFDLSSGNPVVINNSQTSVYQANAATLRGLQIAPNDKIYMVSVTDDNYLLAINNPNVLGTGCNVVNNDVFLSGNTGDKTLPTFVAGYSYDNLDMKGCFALSLEEHANGDKEVSLVKIVDALGRETQYQPNQVLIYVYSDGSTKKMITVE